jgi:hypothetical protein
MFVRLMTKFCRKTYTSRPNNDHPWLALHSETDHSSYLQTKINNNKEYSENNKLKKSKDHVVILIARCNEKRKNQSRNLIE